MSVTYRPKAEPATKLDEDAVRATFRLHGGRGVERTYGWTAEVLAALRGGGKADGPAHAAANV